MKRDPVSLALPAKFSPNAEFFDVEGIPVSLAAVPALPYSVAWDAKPPRSFDPESARRNGAPIDESEFRALVASAHAAS